MIGSVLRVLVWSLHTEIKGRLSSAKIIFCIVNEHTAAGSSLNDMMEVSVILSENAVEQWGGTFSRC